MIGKGLALDANTVALWHFAEPLHTDPLVDELGRLTLPGRSYAYPNGIGSPLGRWFIAASAEERFLSEAPTPWVNALMCEGTWTWEMVAAGHNIQGAIYPINVGGAGGTLDEQLLCSCRITGRAINLYWQTDVGQTHYVIGTGGDYSVLLNPHEFSLLTYVSERTGPTQRTIRLYVNEALAVEAAGRTLAGGGENARVALVTNYGNAGRWGGVIAGIRLSDKARTPEEITESYQRTVAEYHRRAGGVQVRPRIRRQG